MSALSLGSKQLNITNLEISDRDCYKEAEQILETKTRYLRAINFKSLYDEPEDENIRLSSLKNKITKISWFKTDHIPLEQANEILDRQIGNNEDLSKKYKLKANLSSGLAFTMIAVSLMSTKYLVNRPLTFIEFIGISALISFPSLGLGVGYYNAKNHYYRLLAESGKALKWSLNNKV